MKRTAVVTIVLLVFLAAPQRLVAQRTTAIGPSLHSDATVLYRVRDASRLIVWSPARRSPRDSAAATKRHLTYTIVGGITGALLGAVAGNQYAQTHKPPCVVVPAGPPCRYLDTDDSAMHRTTGVVLGAGLGALVGVLLAR